MAEAAAAAAPTKEDLPVVFPDVRLDGSRHHNQCMISADHRSLKNSTDQNCPSPSNPNAFRFLGTCGTAALPAKTCYWQVCVKAIRNPFIVDYNPFCEVGVATMETLNECESYSCVIETQRPATAVVLRIVTGNKPKAYVYQSSRSVIYKELSYYYPPNSVTNTLGFLLDVPKNRLAILDVTSHQVICKPEVDLSQPLWPFFNLVHAAAQTKARVSLHVESGEDLTLTPGIVTLIRSMLEESG